MRSMRIPPALVVPLVSLLFVTGCAAGPRPDSLEPGGVVLDREYIEETRARNALEVLERSRTHLTIQRTREGSPARVTYRGVNSLLLDPQVLVVINGTPVQNVVEQLRDIPVAVIDYVQILSGREAAPRYGSVAGNGAIVVLTSARTPEIESS